MSASDAVNKLAAMFGEPRTPDPELFLDEYAKALKGWDGLVLDRAVSEAIRECVYWPKPADIIQRAERIAAEMYKPKPFDDRYAWRPEPTPEEKARVQALVDAAKKALSANGLPADTVNPPDWKAGQRPGFEKMQRESPNHGLHRAKGGRLTDLSRRMSGDDA